MPGTVRVTGLREVQRAFKALAVEEAAALRGELLEAAEPVRVTAGEMAVSNIRNIGSRWSQMKKGATLKGAYVAPAARRRGGSPRPNLAPLLLRRALEPALEKEQPQVIARVEAALDALIVRHGF